MDLSSLNVTKILGLAEASAGPRGVALLYLILKEADPSGRVPMAIKGGVSLGMSAKTVLAVLGKLIGASIISRTPGVGQKPDVYLVNLALLEALPEGAQPPDVRVPAPQLSLPKVEGDRVKKRKHVWKESGVPYPDERFKILWAIHHKDESQIRAWKLFYKFGPTDETFAAMACCLRMDRDLWGTTREKVYWPRLASWIEERRWEGREVDARIYIDSQKPAREGQEGLPGLAPVNDPKLMTLHERILATARRLAE